MKCPKCGGNAELSNWGSYIDPDYADFHVECEKCGYHSMGSTDPQKAKEMFEKEMGMYYTNEQWLRILNTEQLAEFLIKAMIFYDNAGITVLDAIKNAVEDKEKLGSYFMESVLEWLKQTHNNA